jgi:hypothetical protein
MNEELREYQYNEEETPYAKLQWEEIKGAEYRRFQWGNEPELIHIIKTGFEDRYMVIWEDAYELHLGNVDHLSKQEIEEKFKIKL